MAVAVAATRARQAASAPQTAPQIVVEASDGSFNPAQIYKDASPGVVTIDSVFEGGVNDILGGAARPARDPASWSTPTATSSPTLTW